ncbi:MAG: hypothetical protein KY456_10865 [Chloroflexi bacterium]|nr:hypothetical protein [Chloroflexota bacterium]
MILATFAASIAARITRLVAHPRRQQAYQVAYVELRPAYPLQRKRVRLWE